VRADGEVDLPSRLPELGGDLNTRGPGADHEEVPGGELLWVAVGGGVDLRDVRMTGDDRRDDGLLERPGRRDHEAGVEGALGGLHREAGTAVVLPDQGHLDPAADRSRDLLRVGLEVVGDLFLRHEGPGGGAELEPGEPVVPRGPVRHEGVPAPGAPFLCDAPPFEDDVRHAGAAEMLAHCDAGLAPADHDDFGLFDAHDFILWVSRRCGWAAR